MSKKRLVRDGSDYEPQTISTWRLRELLAIEKCVKHLIISWDADHDEEFYEACEEARTLLGFKLADDVSDDRSSR